MENLATTLFPVNPFVSLYGQYLAMAEFFFIISSIITINISKREAGGGGGRNLIGMFGAQHNVHCSSLLTTDVLKVLIDLDETSKRRVDVLQHFVVSSALPVHEKRKCRNFTN